MSYKNQKALEQWNPLLLVSVADVNIVGQNIQLYTEFSKKQV
jgi:hypothetical protein